MAPVEVDAPLDAPLPPTPRTPGGTRARPPPLYASADGEQELRKLYSKTLSSLPFPYEERLVETPSFGGVHVTICGPNTAPPLVLWHGTALPAPFTLPHFQPLVARFRVYAPDLPCQAGGKSDDVFLDHASRAHGRWCAEVVEGLGLLAPAAGGAAPRPPLHVGVSLGGAMVMDLAVVNASAIGGAALVVPACLHPDSDGKWALTKAVAQWGLGSQLYRLLPCQWTSWLVLSPLCDEPRSDDPSLENLRLTIKHVSYFPPPPLKFTDEQLQKLQAPTLVLCAEHDLFGAGQATADRAQKSIPDCEARVLKGAKHLPGEAGMREVNERILSFFAERGLAGPHQLPPEGAGGSA